jgi:hypothetical protein
MIVASVLGQAKPVRRDFDPTKKDDLLELRYFLDNNKWRNGCPFRLVGEFSEIPYQCLVRFAKAKLPKPVETDID